MRNSSKRKLSILETVTFKSSTPNNEDIIEVSETRLFGKYTIHKRRVFVDYYHKNINDFMNKNY